MSQSSIYNLLAKEKKALSAKEIIKKTKLSGSPVQSSLSKLLKFGEIKVIERRGNNNHKARYYFI